MEFASHIESSPTNGVCDQDRELVLLYNECVEFVACHIHSTNSTTRLVKRIAGSIQKDVSEIKRIMWEESDVQLGPEYYDVDPGVPLYEPPSGGTWWEGVNIFDEFSTSLHTRLLDLRPPEDSIAYTKYIHDLIKKHLTYHGRRLGRRFNDDMDRYFQYSNTLERACEEIHRIHENMQNGPALALELYLVLKLKILQFPHVTILDWAQTDHHAYITKIIAWTMRLPSRGYNFPPSTFTRYCGLIKERMHRRSCEWGQRGEYRKWIEAEANCIHDMLVPDLDLFQRYAYFEVRDKVHLALAKHLPAELMMLVFEYTLAAEGLSLDPRVLVDAYCAESTPKTALKSRMECSHLSRCPRERGNRSGYGCTQPDEFGPEYVVGPEWKEAFPHFPHSQIGDMDKLIAMDLDRKKACAMFASQAGRTEASLYCK